MGYAGQLRVLLWKNFTLKKRAPAVTICEIVIPLVIFGIIVLLRSAAPQTPQPSQSHPARPLLSAGVFPVLELGCDAGNKDAYGFVKQDESLVHNILDILHGLTEFIKDVINNPPGRPPRVRRKRKGDNIDRKGSKNNVNSKPEEIHLLQLLTEPESFLRTHRGSNFTIDPNSTNDVIDALKTLKKDQIAEINRKVDLLVGRLDELFKDPKIDFPPECTLPGISPVQDASDNEQTTGGPTTRRPWTPEDGIIEEILRAWRIMKYVFCNYVPPEAGKTRNILDEMEEIIPDFPLEEIIRNLLKRKLRILYAPRGGQVDEVINEIIGSLSFITDITRMAQYWFEISTKIREDLNRTIHDPVFLNNDQKHPDPMSSGQGEFKVNSAKASDGTTRRRFTTPPTWTGPTRPRPPTTRPWWWWGSTTRRPWWTGYTGQTGSFGPSTPRYTGPTQSAPPMPTLPPAPTQNPVRIVALIIMRLLDVVDSVACIWVRVADLELNPIHLFRGFNSETELETYFLDRAQEDGVAVLASLVFNAERFTRNIPNDAVYKIRMNASFTQTTRQARSLWWNPRPEPLSQLYYYLGFSWIQDLVDRAITNIKVGYDVLEPGLYIQEMPRPCYVEDNFQFVVEHMMPLSLMLAWLFPVAMLARAVAMEKENRIREMMKLMGMAGSVHWVSWFITALVQAAFVAGMLTCVLKFGRVLRFSDGGLVFFTLLLYGINGIFYSFFMSVIFPRARIAAACAGILFLIIYVPYMLLSAIEGAGTLAPTAVKIFVSIFTPTALGLSGKFFGYLETWGVGLNWNNLTEPPLKDEQFSMMHVLIMLGVSILVYGLLVWYIDNVFPGPYGQPKPWYFCFTKAYWNSMDPKPKTKAADEEEGGVYCVCNTNCKVNLGVYKKPAHEKKDALHLLQVNPLHFEPDPSHLEPTIKMQKLCKTYDSGKVAVRNLSMNLYEGQILSFLGHNGAGKTTTMSMLTGMLPITSGQASIYGHNVDGEMDKIRKILGMCPQHNVLFDNLSVEEHLYFYTLMKGGSANMNADITEMINDLGLLPKRDKAIKTLSGGMKRKLSVGIAFIGGSKAVILDEPTAGVDPSSRRDIWDLLLKYKKGRTIMLSTHHMDEADVLGDRIAVISHGQLLCFGSSLFLKSTFGDGYHLTIVKGKPKQTVTVPSSRTESTVDDKSDSKSLTSMMTQQTYGETASVDTSAFSEAGTEASAASSLATKASSIDPERYSMKLTLFVQTIVNGAYLQKETNQEFRFALPFREARRGTYAKLFRELETHKDMLNIDSYGVSDTKLEEVFLKVIAHAKNQQENGDGNKKPSFFSDMKKMDGFGASEMGDTKKPHGPAPPRYTETADAESLMGSTDQHRSFRRTHRRNKSEGIGGTVNRHLAARSLSWDAKAGMDYRQFRNKKGGASTAEIMQTPGIKVTVVTGTELYLQQFLACMTKRGLFVARNWKGLISQVLLPIIFVTVAMVIALVTDNTIRQEPGMEMSTSQYLNLSKRAGYNHIPISNGRYNYTFDPDLLTNSPIAIDDIQHRFSDPSYIFIPSFCSLPVNGEFSFNAMPAKLMDTFKMESGVGATCIVRKIWPAGTEYTSRCMEKVGIGFVPNDCSTQRSTSNTREYCPNPAWGNATYIPRFPVCSCKSDNRGLNCEADSLLDAVNLDVVSQDRLQNISRVNESLYLEATYDDVMQSRYGALTFGNIRMHVPEWIGFFPLELRRISVRNVAKVWYDTHGFHSIPTYLNAMSNAILRANVPKIYGNPASYGITTINQPMNSTISIESIAANVLGAELVISILVICGMAFIPAGYSLFLVQEKACKAKHLQYVSGLNPVIYWTVNIIFDMILYLVPAFICVGVFRAFNLDAFIKGENLKAVIAVLLMFGFASIPTTYPGTFLFDDPSSAYVFMAVFNVMTGSVCISMTFVLGILEQEEIQNVGRILEYVFLIFPNYALGKALMDISVNHITNEFNALIYPGDISKFTDPTDINVAGKSLIAFGAVGIFCITLTLLKEYNFFMKPRNLSQDEMPEVDEEEDEDVARERDRVLRGGADCDIVRMNDLVKIYDSQQRGNHLAVNRLCLGLPEGECFGMLGINGAGKTTTFKMLTGDHAPSGGNAFIKGYSILKDLHHVRQNIGYCPQFDALYEELTAREHLKLYSELRGIPPTQRDKVVEWALKRLELNQYADKPAGSYSGGNKRKLSTAIALLGNPTVIFLDEPTAGMDPYAKRFLWDLIHSLIKEGRCIILTSHSMEECETLCTRLAIMVQGKFRCLGSVQHLKDKFGDGYSIKLTVKGPNVDDNVEAVQTFIERELQSASLKEHHHSMLHYEMPSEEVDLAEIFTKLEQARRHMPVEDYSVCQNTLDNIFINFVKEQSAGNIPDPVENEMIPEHMPGYSDGIPEFINPAYSDDTHVDLPHITIELDSGGIYGLERTTKV